MTRDELNERACWHEEQANKIRALLRRSIDAESLLKEIGVDVPKELKEKTELALSALTANAEPVKPKDR